jgi:hypothetical protein
MDNSRATIRYNSRMVFAFPLDVGWTPPIFHDSPLSALGPFSGRTIVKRTHETAEPFQFSPAEPVVYATELSWSPIPDLRSCVTDPQRV